MPRLGPHPAKRGKQAQPLQPVAPSSACSAAAPPPHSCRSRQRSGAAPWACLWPCSERHPLAWAAPAPTERRASPATQVRPCLVRGALSCWHEPARKQDLDNRLSTASDNCKPTTSTHVEKKFKPASLVACLSQQSSGMASSLTALGS